MRATTPATPRQRLRRRRYTPAAMAATAPTAMATRGAFSGAAPGISRPVTVTGPGARAGRWSVNTAGEETAVESFAEGSRTTVAPLEPPPAWARGRRGARWFAPTG